jgi:D-glycero-D-manno-heptose 1,7-bisphosphate phosphatase
VAAEGSAEHASVKRGAVFLDKDGTLLVDRAPAVDVATMELMPGAARGLRRLSAAGYPLIVVSNQSGVAMGRFPEEALTAVGQRLFEMLTEVGVPLTGFWYCPHHPDGQLPAYAVDCGCRKPRPGLLLAASQHHDLDLAESWLIGTVLDDVEAGGRAGCRTIFLDNGRETGWRCGPYRTPDAIAADLWEAASLILGARSRELAV